MLRAHRHRRPLDRCGGLRSCHSAPAGSESGGGGSGSSRSSRGEMQPSGRAQDDRGGLESFKACIRRATGTDARTGCLGPDVRVVSPSALAANAQEHERVLSLLPAQAKPSPSPSPDPSPSPIPEPSPNLDPSPSPSPSPSPNQARARLLAAGSLGHLQEVGRVRARVRVRARPPAGGAPACRDSVTARARPPAGGAPACRDSVTARARPPAGGGQGQG